MRHELSPRIEKCNLWMELRQELYGMIAEIDANADGYKYTAANLCPAIEKHKIEASLSTHFTRKQDLLNSIRAGLRDYLSSVTTEKENLFAPAVEATKAEIERIREIHRALFKASSIAQTQLIQMQALHVEKELFKQTDLVLGKFNHVSDRAQLPTTGGVYVITRDVIMYVGQSGNVQTRIPAHSSNGYYRDKDLVSIVEIADEDSRLLVEAKLIDVLKPKLNKKRATGLTRQSTGPCA